MAPEFVQAFLAAVPEASRARLAESAELPAILDEWVRSARAEWPSVNVSELDFMRYAGKRLGDDADPGSLAKLHTDDLYLACGCVQADPEALSCFESNYLRRLTPVVARVTPNAADDVVAALRERLLLPRDAAQGLASYAGRSDLWTWLRVSAVRAAVRTNRRGERAAEKEQDVAESLGLAQTFGAAPEAEHERQRFTSEVSRAVESSLQQLGSADKTLLMQHYVDGLTTVELGRLYSVHRVSISRRLVRARRRLLESARADLIARLRLSASECSSVIRLVRSQLHVTLERVLG